MKPADPIWCQRAEVASLSDLVIIAVVSFTSSGVSFRCASSACRSSAPSTVTLTTLAESKCVSALSSQVVPVIRS